MELLWKVSKTGSTTPDVGRGRDRTGITEVTYIVPGELSEDSALRMRAEFVEMVSAMFGPREIIREE